MSEKIKALAEKYNEYIIEKRRFFHMYPELPLHEEETTKSITKELEALGLKPQTFEGINGELYTNAWRAQFLSGLMMPLMAVAMGVVLLGEPFDLRMAVGAAVALLGLLLVLRKQPPRDAEQPQEMT